jgi:hypothetical protein
LIVKVSATIRTRIRISAGVREFRASTSQASVFVARVAATAVVTDRTTATRTMDALIA